MDKEKKKKVKEQVRPFVKEVISSNVIRKQYSMKDLKRDAEKRKDLTKYGKTIGNFIKDHYQTLMDLAKGNKKKEIIKLLKTAKKSHHVSDKYLQGMFDAIDKSTSPIKLQHYLSNVFLAASGLKL